MSAVDPAALGRAMEATWPPVATRAHPPWLFRDGAGGGKRVSAATAIGPVGPAGIETLLAAHRTAGTDALVRVRAGEDALDAALAAAGFAMVDPTILFAAPVAVFAPPPAGRIFEAWPPLAIQRRIWASGNIGPSRLAVMDRAVQPHISLLARHGDAPAGTAFAAIAEDVAVLHAIEVVAGSRRQGVGTALVQGAADWARRHGAGSVALAVTRANSDAHALYRALGMVQAGHYHYRLLAAEAGG